MDFKFIQKIVKPLDTKIVMLVMDGLGGLANDIKKFTELEAAFTPNLDELAKKGVCGLHQPIDVGITPGSASAHLSLFGYDPVEYQVRRGVLSALGINFKLQDDDIAVRGNFCTIDNNNKIKDRRAGRIKTSENRRLCKLLNTIRIPGVEIIIKTIKDHRFLLVLRGKNLSADITDTDPQQTDVEPLRAKNFSGKNSGSTDFVNKFISRARRKLKDQNPANMVLLRGFSKLPHWPVMTDVMQLNAAAIATYPMYRGVAKLAGMNVLKTGVHIDDEFNALEKSWPYYDFFFLHVKSTYSEAGDSNFEGKIKLIEYVDRQIPRLMQLQPDVVIVTGDHSTPALFGMHSWHPVPVLLWSKSVLPDRVERFGERQCIGGGLGPLFPAKDLIPLAMANALRLEKYNA